MHNILKLQLNIAVIFSEVKMGTKLGLEKIQVRSFISKRNSFTLNSEKN